MMYTQKEKCAIVEECNEKGGEFKVDGKKFFALPVDLYDKAMDALNNDDKIKVSK